MERVFWVLLLMHVAAISLGAENETASSYTIIPLLKQPLADTTPNTTISTVSQNIPLNLIGSGTANFTLDHLYPPVQGDNTKRNSVPKKGITKEPVKPRKGAEPNKRVNTTNSNSTFKSKPLASETQSTEDEVSTQPDYTALIVGLSLGIAMVLILVSITYWRLRDVWERRQYKRVDFLIDGLYTDT